MRYLGQTFDLHTGGIDNMFPHHEDEIAQSEAANGCRFVNYWMHNNYLIVNGEKMSKSLGNFFTLRDLMAQGWAGPEVRLALLGTHYRKKLNFTLDACAQARKTLEKFAVLFRRLRAVSGPGGNAADTLAAAREEFKTALGDDLNISAALAAVFGLERELNRLLAAKALGAAGAAEALALFAEFNSALGVFDLNPADDGGAAADAPPPEVAGLAARRQEARANRDFAAADAIRQQLQALGWAVTDSPAGPVIQKI
jgi:cysteinyl-tRNA synthetase